MGSQKMRNVEVAALMSPRRSSSMTEALYYYSAPSSPKEGTTDHHHYTTFESNVDTNLKDFEFETSRKSFHLDGVEVKKGVHFEYSRYQLDQHCSEMMVPSMAFADELFSNGQVAPLKLPPRLHGDNKESTKYGCLSSTASSPKSPSSVLRLSFSRKSLWNDEFDPFKTAMDNVRDEKRGMCDQENTYQRQSPLCCQETEPNQENGLSPYKLSKPKGLGIANQLRPLQDVCQENNAIAQSSSIVVVCKKIPNTRKISVKQTNCYGEKRVAGSKGKAVVQYRPKLFLCLGFGSKTSRK